MRVGVISIIHESNTFLSRSTTLDDFKNETLLVGQDVRSKFQDAHNELGGFFQGLADAGIESVPLLAAFAWPLGIVADEAFDIKWRWLDRGPTANPNIAGYDSATQTLTGNPGPNSAYSILNLRLGVTREGLDLSAFVNNATNSSPRLGYSHPAIGSPLFYATALRPLTAGITALYRF